MSTSHIDSTTNYIAIIDLVTSYIDVSFDKFLTTTLGGKMTLAKYTNSMNSAFAITNCFQLDFDRGNIF